MSLAYLRYHRYPIAYMNDVSVLCRSSGLLFCSLHYLFYHFRMFKRIYDCISYHRIRLTRLTVPCFQQCSDSFAAVCSFHHILVFQKYIVATILRAKFIFRGFFFSGWWVPRSRNSDARVPATSWIRAQIQSTSRWRSSNNTAYRKTWGNLHL